MGSSYIGTVGNPPLLTKKSWYTWYNNLLALRQSECPLARPTTYYFSQSGDDDTGDGSQNTPWKTLAKAQTIHNASSGNTAFLFKRGDEWTETTGLAFTKVNCTIADYGDSSLDKPLFNRFSTSYTANWTNDTGNRYVQGSTGTTKFHWVRRTDERLSRILTRVADAATVTSTAFSFFHDSANQNLYINLNGSDPNSYTIECATASASHGITLSGDGSRIENIRVDGWGLNGDTGAAIYGIITNSSGTDSVLVKNCECYFNNSHCMTHVTGSGNNGISTYIGCVAGYCESTAATVYVTYAANGGNETIFDSCITVGGKLPTADATNGTISVYGHTSGAVGSYVGLVIAYNHVTKSNNFAPTQSNVTFVNLEPATNLEDVRAFVIGETFEGGTNTGGMIFTPDCAKANCDIRCDATASAVSALTVNTVGGWFINGYIEVNFANVTQNPYALYNVAAAVNPKIWHTHIHYKGRRGTQNGISYDDIFTNPSSLSSGGDLMNCIISAVNNFNNTVVGFNNIGSRQRYNAYYNLANGAQIWGFTNDPGSVVLTQLPYHVNPDKNSRLVNAGTGLGLEYDKYFNTRVLEVDSNPTIGPLEYIYGAMRDFRQNRFFEMDSGTTIRYS